MALFGFGKKKKNERTPSAKGPAPQKSTVKRIKPKSPSSASGRVGGVKRPSVAVRPSAKKVESARLAAAAQKAQDEAAHGRKVRKSTKGKQLGQLLLKAGKINEEKLDKALAKQDSEGGLLGQIMIDMEFCSRADVAACIKKQRTITTVNLEKVTFDKEALALIPREFCEKNRLIPFELVGNQLCIAMSNALDTMAKNEVRDMTQMHIKIFDSAFEDIQNSIEKYMDGDLALSSGTLADTVKKEEQASAENLVIEVPEVEEVKSPGVADESSETDTVDGFDIIDEIEEIDEVQEIEEISEISEESSDAEIPLIEDVPELAAPSLDNDEDSRHAGDMPSVASYEELDVIEEEIPAPTLVPQQLLNDQRLAALKVNSAYADGIVENGRVSVVKQWKSNVVSDSPVPPVLPL